MLKPRQTVIVTSIKGPKCVMQRFSILHEYKIQSSESELQSENVSTNQCCRITWLSSVTLLTMDAVKTEKHNVPLYNIFPTSCFYQVTKKGKKERSPCQPVLELFDQQYTQELGDLWASAR